MYAKSLLKPERQIPLKFASKLTLTANGVKTQKREKKVLFVNCSHFSLSLFFSRKRCSWAQSG